MAYTRDWSAATSLTPWASDFGQDFTFDSGLVFDKDMTIVTKTNAVYASGTSTMIFAVNGTGTSFPVSNQKFGASIWSVDDSLLMAELETQVQNGDINIWWGFSVVDRITGSRSSVGSISYDNGYTPGNDGTMSIWYSSGTWYNKMVYEATDLGTNSYSNSDYNPTVSSCYLGHYGYLVTGNTHFKLTDGTYSSTVTAAPVGRYFWYDGYYNNGGTQGEKDLTSSVLTVSPIQQYLYLPTAQGAFSSQVTVTLKNDNNQWGSFTGYATSGTSYNPSGVFYVRDAQVESGNETLFAGFLDYKTIEVDALNQTVSITMNSVLSGILDKAIVPPNRINRESGDVGDVYGVIYPQTIGTVSGIGSVSGEESGTITVSPTLDLKANELIATNLTDEGDGAVFRVGEYLSDLGASEGSFSVKKLPNWLQAGDVIVRNRAYPEQIGDAIDGYSFYNNFMRMPLSFYNEPYLDAWGGADLGWNIATPAMKTALESVIISPSMYIYGDEKFIDVLDDFLIAIGGGGCSAYDGQTVNFFVPSPTYLLQDPTGTLNYNTDIYGAFTSAKGVPIRSVAVEYAYDYESRRYIENVRVDTDFSYGDDKKISTWLINHNEDARNMAFFTSSYFSSGATVTIRTDTFNWAIQRPGNVIEINNLPDSFEVNGSIFLVTSRIFNPADKLVTSTVQEITLEASDFFRVGIHDIGGTTGVL